jgi:hypothetical protein
MAFQLGGWRHRGGHTGHRIDSGRSEVEGATLSEQWCRPKARVIQIFRRSEGRGLTDIGRVRIVPRPRKLIRCRGYQMGVQPIHPDEIHGEAAKADRGGADVGNVPKVAEGGVKLDVLRYATESLRTWTFRHISIVTVLWEPAVKSPHLR